MSQPKALVIGASRGIGQSLVKKLLNEGYDTFSTLRSEPTNDHTFLVDLDDPDGASVHQAASDFTKEEGALDLLILNAAICGVAPYTELSQDVHRAFFQTNVIGPLSAVQAFLPALRKGKEKVIVFITSLLGSTSVCLDVARQPAEKRFPISKGPYPSTKAALNQLGIGLWTELGDEGFSVLIIHPGLVKTDMGAPFIKALESFPDSGIEAITVEESVDAVVGTIRSHIAAGVPDVRILNYDGSDLPL